MGLMVFDLLEKGCALLLFLLKLDTKLSFLNKLFKVLLSQTANVVLLKGIDLFLILLLDDILHIFLVECAKRIRRNDLAQQL